MQKKWANIIFFLLDNYTGPLEGPLALQGLIAAYSFSLLPLPYLLLALMHLVEQKS